MIRKLNWEAASPGERIVTIDTIKRVIINHNGYILHHQMFSDLAISMSIEIEGKQLPAFHFELQKILSLSELDPSFKDLDPEKEWMILLNISFSRGSGNLRHEKPAVDG